MRGLRWRGMSWLCALIISLVSAGMPVGAASAFASLGFQRQWEAGEAMVPNFWGPLANAKDGQIEPYDGGPNGMRQVQYFDKGRMEQVITTSPVTSGLLATELVRGQIQIGDASFQPMPPPAIAIAGDPSTAGATYAALNTTASILLQAAQPKIDSTPFDLIQDDGTVRSQAIAPSPATTITLFDDMTRHNVPQAFAQYRDTVGLLNIGYAISEPFNTAVNVAGQQRFVMAQVFERRVLTYTASNPPAFTVEMGNIGLHYYQWRYPTGIPSTLPTATASDPGQAALQFLPAGYTIKSVQTVDLGVEQQQQALVIAENPGRHGQIAVLMVQKNSAWALAFRTKPDDFAIATFTAYPKTSAHPGFVAASYHLCGANCNNGEHTVIRWDGNGNTTIALNGPDDRGAFNAESATGRVSLTGPVYRTQDANCCPSYTYARSWTWQDSTLSPENFAVLPIEGGSALPVPQWLTHAGPLIVSLEPFQHDPVDPHAIAALFKDSFTITDLQGKNCIAPGPAAAQALADLTTPSIGGLWPVDGGFAMTLMIRSSGGAPATAMAQAGDCTLGGSGVGGYLVMIQQRNEEYTLVSVQAVAQPFTIIPNTAIRVPPV